MDARVQEIRGGPEVHRRPGTFGGRERSGGTRTAAPRARRAGDREDAARARDRRVARYAAPHVAHQVDDQGARTGSTPTTSCSGSTTAGSAMRTCRDIRKYIRMGVLGRAFQSEQQVVVLIDEIDKADIEFPNDLLRELDEMAFHDPRARRDGAREGAPDRDHHVERGEGAARTRSCAAASSTTSRSPIASGSSAIVAAHLPALEKSLVEQAILRFYGVREGRGAAQEAEHVRAPRLARRALARGRRPRRDRGQDAVPRDADQTGA